MAPSQSNIASIKPAVTRTTVTSFDTHCCAMFTGKELLFLSDGNGTWTKAMDLTMDGSDFGLGTRSQRYAAVVEDGVVSALALLTVSHVHAKVGETLLLARMPVSCLQSLVCACSCHSRSQLSISLSHFTILADTAPPVCLNCLDNRHKPQRLCMSCSRLS